MEIKEAEGLVWGSLLPFQLRKEACWDSQDTEPPAEGGERPGEAWEVRAMSWAERTDLEVRGGEDFDPDRLWQRDQQKAQR